MVVGLYDSIFDAPTNDPASGTSVVNYGPGGGLDAGATNKNMWQSASQFTKTPNESTIDESQPAANDPTKMKAALLGAGADISKSFAGLSRIGGQPETQDQPIAMPQMQGPPQQFQYGPQIQMSDKTTKANIKKATRSVKDFLEQLRKING